MIKKAIDGHKPGPAKPSYINVHIFYIRIVVIKKKCIKKKKRIQSIQILYKKLYYVKIRNLIVLLIVEIVIKIF